MTHGPSHHFCPKCNAMLPSHITDCPRCGANLLQPSEDVVTGKEIFQITGVVLLIAAIPLVLIIFVAVLCVASTS
jgi:ribosomal protein L40E